MFEFESVHASSPLSRMLWTATILRAQVSQRKRQEETWIASHSATGATVGPLNEGSIVVDVVSSEMAIAQLAKAPPGRTMVSRWRL